MARLLREPLLHFVLLGALLFALDAAWSDDGPGEGEILVSAGRVQNLAALFGKTWQRPPTAEELRAMVDEYVLEEAMYRRGMELGVAEDDAVVRRRVRQKLEFFAEDLNDLVEPTEEELRAWYEANDERYRVAGMLSFRQVYLNPQLRGEALEADAADLLVELRAADEGADASQLGDPTLLAHAHADLPADRLPSRFGVDFAGELLALPTGSWEGPISSAYGLHLVRVDARTPGALRPFEAVREEAARDWSYARRAELLGAFHAEILSDYAVEIEWPAEIADDMAAAASSDDGDGAPAEAGE